MTAKALSIKDNMPLRQHASVYISTTQGLVQVQSIMALPSNIMQSVATINSTSELVGINEAYASFVSQPQGIIQHVFGGEAYRINFSNGIDQGNSWQLGAFIAHLLFANDLLVHNLASEDKTSTAVGAIEKAVTEPTRELIFITTGEINTHNYDVLEISELDKKCTRAKVQIQQWIRQNKQVCFIAPADNFRKPIPDCAIKLTPIHNLLELPNLLLAYDIDVNPLLGSLATQSLPASLGGRPFINKDHMPGSASAMTITEKQIQALPIQNVARVHQKTMLGEWSVILQSHKRIWWAVATIACVLFLSSIPLISKQFSASEPHTNNAVASVIPYVLFVAKSASPNQCINSSEHVVSTGILNQFEKASATALNDTCQLKLVTATNIQTVWLVSETKAIIPLQALNATSRERNAVKDVLANVGKQSKHDSGTAFTWHIPIPKNASQSRHYHLLLFDYQTDLADLQSLDSFLLNLYQQGKQHSHVDLLGWASKTQSQNGLFIIAQSLSVLPQ